jgi:hypothetical protein
MDNPLMGLLEKCGIYGPLHTPPNPPQQGKVQPVGSIEQPFQLHGEQKPSDLTGANVGPPRTKTGPARETNMWGDGDKLPAIPGGIIGGKVGPRPSKKIQEAMYRGFKEEFHGLSKKKK